MIISQEENSPIEDFIISHNVEKVFSTILNAASVCDVETEDLKVFCEHTGNLMKSFVKYIEKVEKDEIKKTARQRLNEILNKGDDI